jgi:prepilin-type N-terminal cleavage/methylation domain-containing protein
MKSITMNKRHHGFSIIELMMVVGILAVLASVAVPGFENYMYRSKTSEAITNLQAMVQGQIRYYGENTTFAAAGPTNIPPSGISQNIDFTADPAWSAIYFSVHGQTLYGYEAVLAAPDDVDCRAIGDLNADGNTSLFHRQIQATASDRFNVSTLYFFDELE